MTFDDDYALSIATALILYGVACVAVGYWLKASISRALREIFRPQPRPDAPDEHARDLGVGA
ncbi:MAG: hypothetical protein ABSD47_01260 [Candidatus Methylomirabilota bacterium]|jgi:hypothetical protein